MAEARTYDNLQPFAAFPLGGLGTGSVTLHASGALEDAEIFNRPALGNKLPYSFFALHARWGEKNDTRVLEARRAPDFFQARGYHPHRVMGLPRFESSAMTVRFPFAHIDFQQDGLPLSVSLDAFTPFIPLQADDSGIPAILFRYTLTNTSSEPVTALLAASMPNVHDFKGFDAMENYHASAGRENRAMQASGYTGVIMDGASVGPDALTYANTALLTPEADARVKPTWYRGAWWDSITDFWQALTKGALAPTEGNDDKRGAIGPSGYPVGSVGAEKTIAPGASETFTFVFAWYVPNRVRAWWYNPARPDDTMRNWYATRFESAWQAGSYLLDNLPRLEAQSRAFSDALYASTLPQDVIDAVASNLTVLTSNTCFRDDTGTFCAWEGCLEQEGSCHGTCTHVWNYAQSAAYLFPAMERSARLNEFLLETEADGKMNFRTQKRFGMPGQDMYAAIDGQLGTIVRGYREYLLSGDDDYLRQIYPAAERALAYAERTWDLDGDGLLEALQHNTYDIEFIGVNPLSGAMYLAALRAMAAMADALGKPQQATAFREKADASAKALDAACFNGEYYIQPLEDVDVLPYQFGKGVLTDQLLGQTMAYLAGLGALLPKEHLRKAAASIYHYNFLTGDKRPPCLHRLYVHDDESGLLLCTWPHGGVPRFPFVYADEVWTGCEYQVATLLIYEGMVDEALQIVSAVRARQDGARRNPFNEMECGFHYARSLAGYGVLVALSGFAVDKDGQVAFEPQINADDFHCFYCDGRHFGILHQTVGADGKPAQRVEVLG